MKKKSILIFLLFLLFFNLSGTNYQTQKKKKDVDLSGKIELKKDFWGRRIFRGQIKNYSRNRLDFIRIDFEMYNKEDKLITVEGVYIKGIKFIFGDATESLSSLKSGTTGSFEVYTSVPADSISRFKYRINYKFFKYR